MWISWLPSVRTVQRFAAQPGIWVGQLKPDKLICAEATLLAATANKAKARTKRAIVVQ
jgi:hypothetical protein